MKARAEWKLKQEIPRRQISWQVREIKSGYILWLQAYLRMIRQNGRFISIYPLQLHHETFTGLP